ncbi:TnsA endonuclease N terminal [Pseudomonas grimontii]|uniref:Heteromeric transposase endonuclease subunit TnsA n=2 Tax=Pseudomonas TaxID=286 RepID=A0A1H1E1J6_9PSED|nr:MULTISPECIES: TnsA endonuclease N-terminal domain-containing protein [Pseudomonas]TWR68184.1 heteromeric transposase endonuclease subunit TnsA [Pseudomonas grimontii]SDQ82604.1 TnsA endonuclease N terminal [Pseudomonas grimontii]
MDTNSCKQPKFSVARRIKSTHRSLSGVYAFRGEGVAFESALERDFISRMDFSREVVSVVSQPVTLDFVARNGRSYTYTPDFLVRFKGRAEIPPMLVEVKPEENWRESWREYLPKWKAAWSYARAQGWSFHIYDESRIRGQSLKNIQFLERFKRADYAKEDLDAVIQTVEFMGAAPIHYLVALHFTGSEALGTSHIFHLIANRQLDCDISSKIDDFLEVSVTL